MGVVSEGLTPTIACRGHAHQTGVQPVLHVALQDAILDQHIGPAGGAFVIDGDGTAAIGQGAVIDDGYARRSHPFAQKICESRGFLAVEVAFEAMTDGLVQQNARPARSENHGHLTSRSGHGVQVDQCLTQGFIDLGLPVFRGNPMIVDGASTNAMGAGFLTITLTHHQGNIQTDQRADISASFAVTTQNLYGLPRPGQGCGHLTNPAVGVASIGIDLGQQLDLVFKGHLAERVGVGIEVAIGVGRRFGHCSTRAIAYGAHGLAGPADGRLAQFGGMGIAGRFACDRA